MAEQAEVTSLSLIQSVDVQSVQAVMDKISQFQAIVKKTLKVDHDYGVIPGTKEPTLLKPGAEKILMLMGLTSEYEVTERVQDYENGFFAFTVTCRLTRNGMLITEGVGHANTRERRYTESHSGKAQDSYSQANTVLKMSKKRSLVDAALTVASLSDIFTQDLEDTVDGKGSNQGATSKKPGSGNADGASSGQIGLIRKKASDKGMKGETLDAWISQVFGSDLNSLTKKQASQVIDALDKYEEGA